MKITKPEQVKIGQIWRWNFLVPLDKANPHTLVKVVVPIDAKTNTARVRAIDNKTETLYYMAWSAILDGKWQFVSFKQKCIDCGT